MYQITVKLEDIGDKLDSRKSPIETPSFFDTEHLTQITSAMKVELKDEKITSQRFHDLHGLEHQSVKTEMEDVGVSHQHPHFIEDEIKLEIVESDVKRECFPQGTDDLLVESSLVVQGTSICNWCKRAFTTSKYLKTHTRKCRNIVYNQLSTSSDNVSAAAVLQKYPKLMRDQEGLYQCENCDYKFKSQNRLYHHARTHSGVVLHTCRECSKQFTRPSALATHMLIHTKEKPHKCTQCEVAFNTASGLKRHMLMHSGVRAHICSVCEKSFTQSWDLTKHMRIHTAEKPYQCTQCNKSFTVSSHLTPHMRTHTGEKPYKCTVCNRALTQNSSLRTHMKTHSRETGNKP